MIQNQNPETIPETIFVTGGTGFVGSAVCRAALRKGYRVIALSRNGEKNSAISVPAHNLHYCKAAIADTVRWSPELRGCVALIHCIGILFQNPHLGLTHSRITVGTARIAARAAHEAGVPLFALVSARKSPPPLHAYSRAKDLAERGVRSYYPNALIVRPGILTGASKPFMSPLSWFLPAEFAQDVDLFADALIESLTLRIGELKH